MLYIGNLPKEIKEKKQTQLRALEKWLPDPLQGEQAEPQENGEIKKQTNTSIDASMLEPLLVKVSFLFLLHSFANFYSNAISEAKYLNMLGLIVFTHDFINICFNNVLVHPSLSTAVSDYVCQRTIAPKLFFGKLLFGNRKFLDNK